MGSAFSILLGKHRHSHIHLQCVQYNYYNTCRQHIGKIVLCDSCPEEAVGRMPLPFWVPRPGKRQLPSVSVSVRVEGRVKQFGQKDVCQKVPHGCESRRTCFHSWVCNDPLRADARLASVPTQYITRQYSLKLYLNSDDSVVNL